MSIFDKNTRSDYVETLRQFLNVSKKGFLLESGMIEDTAQPRLGRAPRYKDEPVALLEDKANLKAALCDEATLTVGERLRLARDYAFLTDSDIGREMGVTREMVRRWGIDLNVPKDFVSLAKILNAPEDWLKYGGTTTLPADSRIGVRVGVEALFWREQLYGMTLQVMTEYPEEADDQYAQAYIEWSVKDNPAMTQAARKAGGRWQVLTKSLHFVPWEPIKEHSLTRRFWSDEVESIIEEELTNQPTTYRAWEIMRQRCEALGLTAEQYPKRITLFKRIEKETKRADTFGVNLNPMIAISVKKFEEADSQPDTLN